jgi:hypothetical protein
MLEPSVLICGHTICNLCSEKIRIKICPYCRAPFSIIKPNYSLKDLIGRIKIKCYNNECDWRGYIKNFENHNMKCEFNIYQCHWCELSIKKIHLKKHILEKCEYRASECKYCKDKHYFRDVNWHMEICILAPIKCEYCDHSFPEHFMEKHINKKHPTFFCYKCLNNIAMKNKKRHETTCKLPRLF